MQDSRLLQTSYLQIYYTHPLAHKYCHTKALLLKGILHPPNGHLYIKKSPSVTMISERFVFLAQLHSKLSIQKQNFLDQLKSSAIAVNDSKTISKHVLTNSHTAHAGCIYPILWSVLPKYMGFSQNLLYKTPPSIHA